MWASFKPLTPTAPILLITQRGNAKKLLATLRKPAAAPTMHEKN